MGLVKRTVVKTRHKLYPWMVVSEHGGAILCPDFGDAVDCYLYYAERQARARLKSIWGIVGN